MGPTHCSYNAKLPRFNSRFYQPGAEAVDAFMQTWDFENNWLVPPVSQIAKVITHLRLCKAEGTLVIPMWMHIFGYCCVAMVNIGCFCP